MRQTIRRALFVVVAFIIFLALFGGKAGAQTSGETEVGTDNRGGAFASQYVFQDWERANGFVRYFFVNDAVNRAEFAFGPTFKFGKTTVKAQPGFNTSGALKLGGLVASKVGEHAVLYIIDQNWAVKRSEVSWLYQKLFVAIDERSVWQVRIETLHLGQGIGLAFLRIGGEWQYQFDAKHHLYVAPFYDPKVRSPGVQFGYRFF